MLGGGAVLRVGTMLGHLASIGFREHLFVASLRLDEYLACHCIVLYYAGQWEICIYSIAKYYPLSTRGWFFLRDYSIMLEQAKTIHNGVVDWVTDLHRPIAYTLFRKQ